MDVFEILKPLIAIGAVALMYLGFYIFDKSIDRDIEDVANFIRKTHE